MTITKRFLTVAAFVMLAIFSGCAVVTPPSQEQMLSADYGPIPTEDQIQRGIVSYLEPRLKDPDSALTKNITKPKKGYLTLTSIAAGSSYTYGWIVHFEVNAKNSYGGYVGYKEYSVVFRDGKVMNKQ
ncbi:MAG TPA: hypothetical protein PKC80_02675 [Burkholderiaceae bacterium]|nr:hypothetical protein [Burkholderiaceae bacterium]